MPATLTPGALVCERFGGAPKLAKLLSLSRTTTYRWSRGFIPRTRVWQLQQLARREGVSVSRQEWIAALGGE